MSRTQVAPIAATCSCRGVFDAAALPPDKTRAEAVERAWAQLCAPGPTLDAPTRVRVIELARAAWRGAGPTEPSALAAAVHAVASDAEGITLEFVEDLERRGLPRLQYLEVLGVVGRLSNVDWYLRGLGAALPQPVPLGLAGVTTGRVAPGSRLTDSWVPMVGDASAPHVLDALVDEGAALRDLHEPAYIDIARIGEGTHGDVLARPQIEFIAARTSYLNECFY
ncbi:MAG: hypothetical protein ACR2P0_04875 [Acidimicrobiales bacterium]